MQSKNLYGSSIKLELWYTASIAEKNVVTKKRDMKPYPSSIN